MIPLASEDRSYVLISFLRPGTMLAVLGMIREKFGSVEGYLKTHTSLDDKDIEIIRANVLAPKVD